MAAHGRFLAIWTTISFINSFWKRPIFIVNPQTSVAVSPASLITLDSVTAVMDVPFPFNHNNSAASPHAMHTYFCWQSIPSTECLNLNNAATHRLRSFDELMASNDPHITALGVSLSALTCQRRFVVSSSTNDDGLQQSCSMCITWPLTAYKISPCSSALLKYFCRWYRSRWGCSALKGSSKHLGDMIYVALINAVVI